MKLFYFTLFTFLIFIGETKAASSPLLTGINPSATETVVKKKTKQSYKTLRKETEKLLGRKLKLSERIGLWASSHMPNDPYDKTGDKKAENQAIIGFGFGIASIVLFSLFAIPGFILSSGALAKEKNNPGTLDSTNKVLARLGQIFSIVGFAILVFTILYFLALAGIFSSPIAV